MTLKPTDMTFIEHPNSRTPQNSEYTSFSSACVTFVKTDNLLDLKKSANKLEQMIQMKELNDTEYIF